MLVFICADLQSFMSNCRLDICRECYSLLPQALQVLLLESCASAATAMGSRARSRPGQGPGPQVQLKRIMPGTYEPYLPIEYALENRVLYLMRMCVIIIEQRGHNHTWTETGSTGGTDKIMPLWKILTSLHRLLAGSPSLQPIHLASADLRSTAAGSGSNAGGGLRRSETNASSHGPFIFNPYAAKRKGASAAAAAEAALPEWVRTTDVS